MRRRFLLGLVLVTVGTVIAVVFAGTFVGPDVRTLPPPSSTSSTAPEPSTTVPDFSRIALPSVPGETTTTLATTGDAVLTGVVTGPEGPVPGAIVRVERLVDDAVQGFEVRTAEDGTWALQGVPGGRFRVRAYRPPDLLLAEPVVFYLRDGDRREIPLPLQPFTGVEVLSGVTPEQPVVGDAVNLAVRVTQRVVGEDGIGRLEPLPKVRVRVRSTGWRELEEPLGITDEDGTVVFTYECERATPVTATAIVGEDREPFPLQVPDCEAPATTTTSSTTTTSTTTTTRPTTTTSSTTTEPE